MYIRVESIHLPTYTRKIYASIYVRTQNYFSEKLILWEILRTY